MRVVIGEDEALLREGLSALLTQAGFTVVAAVGDAPALLEAVDTHRPDLLLTDIRMPPNHADDGLRAAMAARNAHPGLPVMVLSQFVSRRYALDVIGENPAGVGYQLKQRVSDVDGFLADLRRVGAGGTALDPHVVAVMLNRARSSGPTGMHRLTARQREVLALIAEGCSNAAIATRLSITERAVVAHASRIYDELGITDAADGHRRVLAVIRYLNA